MRLSKKERERVLKQSCGIVNEDDAIDPKHYFSNKRKSKTQYRKAYQLCRQVADTFQLVLTNDDPELDGLIVLDVVPAPDSRRMLVLLALPADQVKSASEVDAIMARLQTHVPRLRSEIARSINRRKTPQLLFEITAR